MKIIKRLYVVSLGDHYFDDFDDARAFGGPCARIRAEFVDQFGRPLEALGSNVNEKADQAEDYINRLKNMEFQTTEPVAQMAAGVTPQDLGQPSPVPYTLFYRQPSADIDPAGKETTQISASAKDLKRITAEVMSLAPIDGLDRFIKSAFDDFGVYRLEIVVGDASIKIYKHPNN